MGLDGRGTVPQVPPVRWSVQATPQHAPGRARLCRAGRHLLGGRWRGRGPERARQVTHARARSAARRGVHARVSDFDRLFLFRPQDERNTPLRDIFWGSFLAILFSGFHPLPPKTIVLVLLVVRAVFCTSIGRPSRSMYRAPYPYFFLHITCRLGHTLFSNPFLPLVCFISFPSL